MINLIIGAVIGYFIGQKYNPAELKEKTLPLFNQAVATVKDLFSK